MTADFGAKPLPMKLNLFGQQDFTSGLELQDEMEWDGEVFMTLTCSSGRTITWPATVSGSMASWFVDKEVVAVAIAAGASRASITYTTAAGFDWLLFKGAVCIG